jgi:hypothetical protein
VEHPPTDPFDVDDDTLLGDAAELDHPSIEEQLDEQLEADLDDDEDI